MKKLLTFGASEKYFYKESLSEEERKHKAQSILKANKFIPLVIEGPLLATHSPNPYMAYIGSLLQDCPWVQTNHDTVNWVH